MSSNLIDSNDQTEPIIKDLLLWLKENLPPDTDEQAIFKKVHKVQKVLDSLICLCCKNFYDSAVSQLQLTNNEDDCPPSLDEAVNKRLKEIEEYISLSEEKNMKTKKLIASRAKLDLIKEQHQLVTSIKLDSCMDLISRYNHLMSKK